MICQIKCPVCPEDANTLQSKQLINTVHVFCLRTSPRLLCAATQQKNTGQNLEEDQSQSQNEHKVEPSSAEKMLTEEKAKLEEQLKEVTVSVSQLLGCTPHTYECSLWFLGAQSKCSCVTAG